jgi:hypothetical protein
MDEKPTLAGKILGHAIAWFFCIGFPAIVTAIAPVSWLKYERHGDRVTAQAKTCLLFVVPYKTVTVDPVIGFGNRTKNGSVKVYRRQSTGRYDDRVKTEDQGFLSIQGPDQTAEVSITPVDLPSVVEKSNAFLKDPQATELRQFVVANWKFSVFGGAFVSSLLVLYLGGCLFALGRWLLRLVGMGRHA